MKFSVFGLILAACTLVSADTCNSSDPLTPATICSIRAAFGGSLVVPNVIPTFLPTGLLHLVYGTVDVGGAQQLSPSRVGSAPIIRYDAINGTTSGPEYLLILTDPDGTDPYNIIWLWSGLTVDTSENNLLSSSSAAEGSYISPDPAEGTGTHKYVALLYTQPSGFSMPSKYQNLPSTLTGNRLSFSLSDFVSDNNLGDPVGGNFFKSEYDGTTGTNTAVAATAGSSSSTKTSSSSAVSSSSSVASSASVVSSSSSIVVASPSSSSLATKPSTSDAVTSASSSTEDTSSTESASSTDATSASTSDTAAVSSAATVDSTTAATTDSAASTSASASASASSDTSGASQNLGPLVVVSATLRELSKYIVLSM